MTEDVLVNAQRFMRQTGWVEGQPGVAGALWAKHDEQNKVTSLGVPHRLWTDMPEWDALVRRLSQVHGQDADSIRRLIIHFDTDIARLRAANNAIIGDTIPLRAGFELVDSALKMLRASATTARGPRAHIGSNYSRLGDEIVSRARMGQTERGSYVVPILVPLTEPQSLLHQTESLGFGEDIDRVAPEPSERRVTRTLAQALAAVDAKIVQPARPLRKSEAPELVAAGVSRELVAAVSEVLHQPAVAELEVRFAWAGLAMRPAGTPELVEIPAGSAELMDHAATLLRTERRDIAQRLTGPIIEVRHLPDDPWGHIVVQTIRHGRSAEVRVRLPQAELAAAHDWMKTARTVVVEGHLVRVPGRPLAVESGAHVYPLDSTFLPSASPDA